MSVKVFLVHGWSVSDTTTYQALHAKLGESGYDLHEIFLGRYVTLDDQATIPDLARAMHQALVRQLGKPPWQGQTFHIITHSTGALVVRQWIANLYDGKAAQGRPLKNVVFLAGPHFGSRLAHQGRSMLSRIRYGGDTGREILNALELGSDFSWRLNEQWLDTSTWKKKGVRPYCLIGSTAKPGFLARTLVPATNEKGSDGVVRVATGNLNFRRYEVDLVAKRMKKAGEITGVPFGALEPYEHSGPDTGIMNSIKTGSNRRNHQAFDEILKCLAVKNATEYREQADRLAAITAQTGSAKGIFAQVDFRIRDMDGKPVRDYSIVMGHPVREGIKPAKIVSDVHKNRVDDNHISFYLDMSKVDSTNTYVLSIEAETGSPLVEFDDSWRPLYTAGQIHELLMDHQTTQVDVRLSREPGRNLFVFHPGDSGLLDGTNPDGPPLHVKWNRLGEITDSGREWE
jgi:hypothetical protein